MNDIVKSGGTSKPVKKLDLSTDLEIDVSELSDEQIKALSEQHATNMTELRAHAAKRHVDLKTTEQAHATFNETVKQATNQGASATITNVREDSLGRTETIIGNTEHAARGKMTGRQAGEDNTLKYVIVIAIAVVAAIAFAN